MRVILITDVDSVGRMGEIKEIKNGLARNYLIPQKMAIRATPGNIKIWEQKSNYRLPLLGISLQIHQYRF